MANSGGKTVLIPLGAIVTGYAGYGERTSFLNNSAGSAYRFAQSRVAVNYEGLYEY